MKELTFKAYYNAITYDTPLEEYKEYFNGYALSEDEIDVLVRDLDHYQLHRRAIHALQEQKLMISGSKLLHKLVERTIEPMFGLNCLSLAEIYYGIEKTCLVLIQYIENERYPEILNRFFQTLVHSGIPYEAYKFFYNTKHPEKMISVSDLSAETSEKLIQTFYKLFLQKHDLDVIYSYHLSNLISLQEDALPKSMHQLMPKVKERAEELSFKTEVQFYDFIQTLEQNNCF